MRFQGTTLAALLLSLLTTLLSNSALADGPLDRKNTSALMLSIGQASADTDTSLYGVKSGWYIDSNYTRTYINGGAAYLSLGNADITNVYAGTGYKHWLQLQVGAGTEGFVRRVRSDINIADAYNFLRRKNTQRTAHSLASRITLSFASEIYGNDRYDNVHMGVGLLY